MKKVSSLLAALTALCLMCALPGSALLQIEHKTPETAQTGGWPAELIGSWVGLHENLWEQYTFYANGRYDRMVFESPDLDQSGPQETIRKAEEMAVEGDSWHFASDGAACAFRRIPTPYFRVRPEKMTVVPSVDPLLLGTYGGRIGGSYVEWTFRGDGIFTRVTPYETVKEDGHYIACDGNLAILLKKKLIYCAYKVTPDSLKVDLPDQEGVTLVRKAGQLTQFELRTDKDLGLDINDFAYTFRQQKPQGLIARRYFGTQSEVGMFWGGYSMVVGIGDGAFKGNKTIQSVTVPDFVIEIGNSAFEGCESLKNILFIGSNLNWPDQEAYKEVIGFSVIPGSCPLKTIGDAAFRGCVSLENLNLAKSARQSPWSQYFIQLGRSDIKGINIPDGVTSIGAYAFEGCQSIISVSIPDSVTEIGMNAFKGCDRMTLVVGKDSYPMRYAGNYGIPFILRGE